MARPTTRERSVVSEAIIELRQHIGDTQEQFARRLDSALGTIGRYETSQPPSGTGLRQFMELALKHGRPDLVEIFRESLSEELGLNIPPAFNQALMKLLSVLPREWSDVIRFRFNEGVAIEEIAKAVNIEIGEVRRVIDGVLSLLRAEFDTKRENKGLPRQISMAKPIYMTLVYESASKTSKERDIRAESVDQFEIVVPRLLNGENPKAIADALDTSIEVVQLIAETLQLEPGTPALSIDEFVRSGRILLAEAQEHFDKKRQERIQRLKR